MSNDDVVYMPVVATVDPCAKLRAECNRLENEKSGAEFRCRELLAERNRLRKALRATDALLDPAIPEHRERIEDNAELIAEGWQDE
jgi:hypothetical protein